MYKSNLRWSNSSKPWPQWEQNLANVRQGLRKILLLLSGSALKQNSFFSGDRGLFRAEVQLLLWGMKSEYAGFTLERQELDCGLLTQMLLAPVYLCHFLHIVEASGLIPPQPPAEQSTSRRTPNPAELFCWLEREPNAGVSVKLIQSRCKIQWQVPQD